MRMLRDYQSKTYRHEGFKPIGGQWHAIFRHCTAGNLFKVKVDVAMPERGPHGREPIREAGRDVVAVDRLRTLMVCRTVRSRSQAITNAHKCGVVLRAGGR